MTDIIFIVVGGFVGAICRYSVSKKFNKQNFPVGTLMINLLGSFLLGVLAGMQIKGHIYSLLGIGFMGAFTTFSTLQLESEQLRINNRKKVFYLYLAISYGVGILLAFSGMLIGKTV